MVKIEPHSLWIGHAGDGRDFPLIFANNIEAVFYLAAEEPLPQVPRELISFRFPLLDGAGNRSDVLYMAASTLAESIRRQIPTLVTCAAGMSRSPAIVAAARSLVDGLLAEASLAEISKCQPCDVSPGLWCEVLELFSQESFSRIRK